MTSVLLLLPAGVKVTFIFTFIRANIIDAEQKFTHKFAFAYNHAVVVSLWVFMGVMNVYGCLRVSGCLSIYMGICRCLWVFLSVSGYLWVFMSFYGCHGYL